MSLIFYIVDVFAEKKYAGNQLAVVKNAESLSDTEMQQIAKEMNYSETTFITKNTTGYNVRIFTPEKEVPFAGHPVLGTAFIIREMITPVNEIIVKVAAGKIPVTFSNDGILWMKQNPPQFFQRFKPGVISPVLSLDEKDIDNTFPIEEVSTGLPFIIVPLKSLDAVKRAKIVKDKYYELIKNTKAKAILVFCPEPCTPGHDLHVRVFVDYYGIPEDPATGSGNGCLAGYLVNHAYFGKSCIDITVEQGYQIGRPSLLYLRAEKKEGIQVFVGGKVIMVAKGELI